MDAVLNRIPRRKGRGKRDGKKLMDIELRFYFTLQGVAKDLFSSK